ncbi:DUF262 domain-containing protein [Halomonas sp.]|uniref:DUF262 domain-containing protein n=1 Tax=Halomonas sp. TaxID=1486246 RepID=UPI00384AF6C0
MSMIKGENLQLHQVLSSEYEFYIPEYQRPYAWGIEQCEELFDDLISFSKEESPEEEYFLGSIVVAKSDIGKNTYDVVDGQQRITTLTILLSAIADRLKSDNRLSEDFYKFIIEEGSRARKIPSKPRLFIRRQDRGIFENIIQTSGAFSEINDINLNKFRDSQFNIIANARYFQQHLKKLEFDEVAEFGNFIVERCVVVLVSTQGIQSAYRIFSVMNDRGLDLEVCDLLKATIISKIPENLRSSYTEKWEEAEERLGRNSFNSLFSYIRMIFAKDKARKALTEEFDRHVIQQCGSPAELIDNIIIPYSEALYVINNKNYQGGPYEKKINQLLGWLTRLNNTDWVPVAIRLIDRYDNQPEVLLLHLEKLERLAAAILIRGSYVNSRIRRYGRVLKELKDNENLLDAGSSLDLSVRRQKETMEYLNGPVYLYPSTIKKYIMLRLDSFLASEGVDYDHSITTLEHVLPQNPSNNSEWLRNWSDEARKEWTHRLGNLVLLSKKKNPQASNHDFEKKKSLYFRTDKGVSLYACSTQVLSYAHWLENDVRSRQRDLLATFAGHWDLQGLESVFSDS